MVERREIEGELGKVGVGKVEGDVGGEEVVEEAGRGGGTGTGMGDEEGISKRKRREEKEESEKKE